MYAIDTRQFTTTTALPTSRTKSKEKEKEKDREKDREKKPRSSHKSQLERLKTVVRRLPPNLPEDIFWQSVQPWVTEETVSWKVYYPGKFRKRLNKENIPSRAYIAFRNEEVLATFSREYDGHLFRDKAGNESVAVVEFAPFQKVPSEKKKVDGRIGTIEKDEDFQSFLESLKYTPSKPFDVDSLETLAAASQPPPQPTSTPLLEALKAEKSAQKDKEAILRAHAHYKDPSVLAGASGSKKDDTAGKGKRGPPSAPAAPAKGDMIGKKGGKSMAKGPPPQTTDSATSSKKTAPNPNGGTPQQGQSQSAPAAKAAQSSTKPTPKSPRRNREKERQDAKAAAATSSTSTAPVADSAASPKTAPTPTPSIADASSAAVTPTTTAAVPSAAPRRTRPMLGLASRHFEAALSGAGVDRKARRERDQARENKDGAGADAQSASAASGIIASTSNTPATSLQAKDNQTGASGAASPRTTPGEPGSGGMREEGGRGGGRGRGRGGRGRGGGTPRGAG